MSFSTPIAGVTTTTEEDDEEKIVEPETPPVTVAPLESPTPKQQGK